MPLSSDLDRFKVASFNLYNLVLPNVKYYGRGHYTVQQYQDKIRWTANQLKRMNADIVGFQEIFQGAALQTALNESGLYKGAQLLVGEEGTGTPAVGLVSRFPIIEHTFTREFPESARLEIDGIAVPITQFSRPVLWARIEIRPGFQIMVFVVHLKSKNPKIRKGADRYDPMEQAIGKARSLFMRAAEATAVRCLLLERLKGNDNPVIIIGDINDTGHAVTSEIMAGAPPWRKLKFQAKARIWDVLMYNVKDIQARQSYRDVYYTHIHNGHYESLDHILVSQEFVHQNPNHLAKVEYVALYNDHLVDDTLSNETVPCWQSDHGQVVATLQLR